MTTQASSRIQGGTPLATPEVRVEPRRPRTTTAPPPSAFTRILRGGAEVLRRGVEVGAAVVGGPIVGVAARAVGGSAGTSSEIDQMRALQEQSQAFNLEYLALQEEVQQENRRFSTLSNVLKARHETVKTAIGNIRA